MDALGIFSDCRHDVFRGGQQRPDHRRQRAEKYLPQCSLGGGKLLRRLQFAHAADDDRVRELGRSRDFAHNTHQILFSTPIRKIDYLAGRFLGSALIAVIPLLGVSVGVLAAKYMPWVDAERFGPVVWAAHWKAILVFAVPNTLFIAAVIFAIAVLTRSTVVSFLGSLGLLAGYGISRVLTSDLKNQKLAALIDPFGIDPFLYATQYWTVAEKNTLAIGYSGYMLWNRLIWLGSAP